MLAVQPDQPQQLNLLIVEVKSINHVTAAQHSAGKPWMLTVPVDANWHKPSGQTALQIEHPIWLSFTGRTLGMRGFTLSETMFELVREHPHEHQGPVFYQNTLRPEYSGVYIHTYCVYRRWKQHGRHESADQGSNPGFVWVNKVILRGNRKLQVTKQTQVSGVKCHMT